jgi:hypothetical protein
MEDQRPVRDRASRVPFELRDGHSCCPTDRASESTTISTRWRAIPARPQPPRVRPGALWR